MGKKFYRTKIIYEYVGIVPLYEGIAPRNLSYHESDSEVYITGDGYECEEITRKEFFDSLHPDNVDYLKAEWAGEEDED